MLVFVQMLYLQSKVEAQSRRGFRRAWLELGQGDRAVFCVQDTEKPPKGWSEWGKGLGWELREVTRPWAPLSMVMTLTFL